MVSFQEYRDLKMQIGGLTHDAVELNKNRSLSGENLKAQIKEDMKMLKKLQDELLEEFIDEK